MGLIHVPGAVRMPGTSHGSYQASFLVDTGCMDSMAPGAELAKAGIAPVGRETYELADGRTLECDFGIVQVEFMGKITAGRIVFGPDDVEPILGVTSLESAGI